MPMREQVTVATSVPTTAAEAWAAFTDPTAITQWNHASEDWCCPSAEVDLRVGGIHKARMEAKDGSMGFDFQGIYEEVEEPRALMLVLDDGRNSRTTFEQVGAETEVTTIFDADESAPIEMQQQGWQSILDNFASYVSDLAK